MSNFTDRLELEREQLIRSWKWRLQRNPMSKPWAQVSRIVQANGDAALDDKSLDSQLRQFHNMLGFRAWGGSAHKGGLCGGTIFRTPGFIRLEQRQFRKKPAGTKTIHIEHTYPVAMLRGEIRKTRFSSEAEGLRWLLRHSVATALKEEEQHFIGNAYRKWSGALIPERTAEFQRPFMRYDHIWEGIGGIWNVFDREEVDRSSFSFDDHFLIVCRLLEEAGAERELIVALRSQTSELASTK